MSAATAGTPPSTTFPQSAAARKPRARAIARALKAARRLEIGPSAGSGTADTTAPRGRTASLRRATTRAIAFGGASPRPPATKRDGHTVLHQQVLRLQQQKPLQRQPSPPLLGPTALPGFTWADVRKVYPSGFAAHAKPDGGTGSAQQRTYLNLKPPPSPLWPPRPYTAPCCMHRHAESNPQKPGHQGGGSAVQADNTARPCSALAVARRACHRPPVAAPPQRPASATVGTRRRRGAPYVPRRSFRGLQRHHSHVTPQQRSATASEESTKRVKSGRAPSMVSWARAPGVVECPGIVEESPAPQHEHADQSAELAAHVKRTQELVRGAVLRLDTFRSQENMDFAALFRKIDHDRSGWIDVREMKTTLAVLWPDGDDALQAVFERLDSDGSGRIVEQEFLTEMAALTAQMQARRAERRRQREAARARENARISLMRRFGIPEVSYRRLGIDRSWHAVCRAVRLGVACRLEDRENQKDDVAAREAKKQETRIRRLFFELDKDGSGMIDAAEVSLLGELLLGEVMTPAQLEMAMDEMDPDGSGEVDFEEFHSWYTSEGDFRRKTMEEAEKAELARLRKIFDQVDTDGGGSIDAEEVKQLARNLFCEELTPLQLQRAMKEMDPDGSGEVDFEEFHAWYTSEGDFRKRAQEEQKRRHAEASKQAAIKSAESIRAAKLEWLRAKFSNLDEDSSGTIDITEFNVLIHDIFGMSLPTEKLEDTMREIDPDGSGEIDFIEFAKWCNRTVPSSRLETQNSWWVVQRSDLTAKAGTLQYHMSRLLRKWFGEVDDDASGQLELPEVKMLAASLLGVAELSDEDARMLMQEMDPDGSGQVDFIEFKGWFEGSGYAKAMAALKSDDHLSHGNVYGLVASARKRLDEIATEQMSCAADMECAAKVGPGIRGMPR